MANLPHADFCSCCSPTAELTPLEIGNRPGLAAIGYRVGTFATFRQAMLNSISRQPALTGMTTRESDDFAITVLELFAAVGDVLTFYNERIANEIFLRTARERESVLRLVRVINYRLNPGQAAIAFLAITLDNGARTRIGRALKVMSVPGQDERPQIFETIEEVIAHGDINLLPAFAPPVPVNGFEVGNARTPLVSRPDPLGPGDRVVVFGLSRIEEKSVAALQASEAGEYLEFAPAMRSAGHRPEVSRMAKMARRLRFFGHNAPARLNVFVAGVPGSPHPWPRWVNRQVDVAFPDDQTTYPLDTRYEDIKPGTHLLIDAGENEAPRLRTAVVTETEDKPAAVTVSSGIAGDPTDYIVQEDTVTHVALRQTMRGRPVVAPITAIEHIVYARSGSGAAIRILGGDPAASGRWAYRGRPHLGSDVTIIRDPALGGRFDVIAMDGDGTLLQRTWTPGPGYSAWITHDSLLTTSGVVQPGAVVTSRPAGLVAAGRDWVLARGRFGDLVTSDITPTTGQTLVSLGGTLTSAPAAVSTDGNTADIFVRGPDRALWWLHWDGAAFTPWQSLGGILATGPAVASTGAGRIDVVAVGDDGHLIHRVLGAGDWNDWTDLGGAVQHEPEIVRTSATSVDVFARGMDGELRHISRNGADWSDWQTLGGVLASGPSVLYQAGSAHVYARGSDDTLVHRQQTASGWSPWESLGDGIDGVTNRRKTRVFQIHADDIEFRRFDYPAPPGGNRIALRLPPEAPPGFALLKKGRRIMLRSGARHHLARVTASHEIASLPGKRPDHLLVDFSPALPSAFADARLLGNIVEASHGETQPDETLGNGDATRAFQKFVVSRDPLTYVPSTTEIEGSAELTIRVDGEQWTKVGSLYGRNANDRVYTVRQEGEDRSVVTFGDGRLGARLPTGAMNIMARYRKGLGLEGRVAANQLSIALERPVGLRAVTNPMAAEGGADPESRDHSRQAAPATVKTLGRAVSLQDFEWIAVTSGLVARADVTWVWHRLERAVHLTVASAGGASLSTSAMETLHAAMTAARDPNRQLFLANLVRVPLVVRAKVLRDPAFEADAVLAAARAAVEDLFAFETVPLGNAVHASQTYAAIQGAKGVVAVDLDEFQLRDFADLTPTERAVRSVTADPLQPHVRIYPARPAPSNPALIDRYARAGFGDGPVPPVLAAEQAYIADPALDISVSVVEAL